MRCIQVNHGSNANTLGHAASSEGRGMNEEKTTFLHGGNRGLQVGDYILPSSETGVVGMIHPLHQADRAYITPSIVDAQFYACSPDHKTPVVYVVEPEGDLEPDPDCARPGGSFTCQKAKIIAIQKVSGKVIKKNRKAMIRNLHQLEAAKRIGPGQR